MADPKRKNLNITVLRDSWQPNPLAWIHRAEARCFANELRRAGYEARLARFRDDSLSGLSFGLLVLRLSDPVMLAACDVAPLVGANSAFAASFEAAAVSRAEQLRMLLNESADKT